MPRYYFHIHNDIHAEDEDGIELADPAAAREQALEGARELVCASVKLGHLNLDHYIRVTDEGGAQVLKVTFRDAFTITG